MKSSLSLCLVIISLAALFATCCSANPGASYKAGRNKPRSIRGFKNDLLSTARGFGKRDGGLEYLTGSNNQEQGAEKLADSLPVEWFVEELRANPELARIVVHKFVDVDQDGELSAEELLRPVY